MTAIYQTGAWSKTMGRVKVKKIMGDPGGGVKQLLEKVTEEGSTSQT